MSDAFLLPNEALVGAGLAGLGVWAMSRSDAPLVWRELRFPATLAHEHVEAMLTRIAAGHGPVVFVVDATAQSVRFRLGAAASQIGGLTSAISGIAPEVALDEIESDATTKTTSGAHAWWPGRWPVLRVDAPEMAVAGLLGSMTGVREGEQIQLVVRLLPAGRTRAPEGGAVGELRNKLAGPLLKTEILLTVSASPEARAHQLRHVVVTSLRTLNGPGTRLRVRPMSAARAKRALASASRTRSWSLTPRTVLSPRELVPIVGLPINAPRIPGIAYGTAPLLMPPRDLPTTGRVLAHSDWPAMNGRPLTHAVGSHLAIVGPTNSGKSSLILRALREDLEAGRGAVVVDAKGDLISDALSQIPENRRGDVILIDPASGGPQPGLRTFPPGVPVEVSADAIAAVLKSLFPDSYGVRTAQFLRMGLNALGYVEGATLLDLPLVLTDPGVRRRVLAQVTDPLLLASFERYAALGERDQLAQIASPLTKLEEVLARRSTRVIVGQSHSKLVWGEVLARKRIVLARLPAGLLGATGSRLLSALLLWGFFSAVEARTALPANKRSSFTAYIDEVAALDQDLKLPFEDLLARARSAGVSLVLAPQALSQLTPALRQSLLANAGGLVAFKQHSADEAKALARELPAVSPEQLQAIERFGVVIRAAYPSGEITAPMTGHTLPPPEPCSDPDQLRRLAGERWGQTIEQVDQAFAERLQVGPSTRAAGPVEADDDEPVGLRRRAS